MVEPESSNEEKADTEAYAVENTVPGEPLADMTLDEYLEVLKSIEQRQNNPKRKWPEKIRKMINKGLFTFTVDQWAEQMGMDRKVADAECRGIYQKGLLRKDKSSDIMRYTFRIIRPPAQKSEKERTAQAQDEEVEPEKRCVPIPVTDELEKKLKLLEHSKIWAYRSSAQAIRRLLSQGITTFERRLWPNMTQSMKPHSDNACDRMRFLGIIRNEHKDVRPAVYTIIVGEAEDKPAPFQEIRDKLIDLRENGINDRDRRIGSFLLGLIEKGEKRFTSADWNSVFHISKTAYGSDLRRALNLGLVQKIAVGKGGNLCLYELCSQQEPDLRADSLTLTQRKNLADLYVAYWNEQFTVEDCAKVLGLSGATAAFHLKNFAERGLLEEHRHPGRAFDYSFRVNPDRNPECFAQSECSRQINRSIMPNAISGGLAVAVG